MRTQMVSKYKDQIWLICKSKHFVASVSACVIVQAQALELALVQALARWQVVNLRGTQRVCLSDFLHICECRQLV